MTSLPFQLLACAIAAYAVVCPLAAQQRAPASPPRVESAVGASQSSAQQLRRQIETSGWTPEQIRSRLLAAGYPESLLDSYLPGGAGLAGERVTPSASDYAAVKELGIVVPTDTSTLRSGAGDAAARGVLLPGVARADTLPGQDAAAALRDSARGDSVGLQVFGMDVFRRSTSQFEPTQAGAVDAGYKVGPGDVLVLLLSGGVEAAYTLDVTREGFVLVPQVGTVYVANLTMDELRGLLYAKLGAVYSGVRPGPGARTRLTVSVARTRVNQVFVIGDVARPGSYQVSSLGTLLTALYAAGGPGRTGTLRAVEVRRGGRTVATFDMYDYLVRGDAARDVRLESGDVVFVPFHGPQVTIAGEIGRPAVYELRPGETLADLVRMAGGFTAIAAQRRVQVTRVLPPSQRTGSGRDRVVVDVAADQLAAGTGGSHPLEAGDSVQVFAVVDRVRDRVYVAGHVWAPGALQFRPGMRLSEALAAAGGVRAGVSSAQVLVTRLQDDESQAQLRTQLAGGRGGVANDIVLQEEDSVRVFSTAEFRPARFVAITGAVRGRGRYPYRDDMTLRDLVQLAGGLEDGALLDEAEVARLPRDPAPGVLAEAVRVPLDSTYLFERSPDAAAPRPGGRGGLAVPEVRLRAYDNVVIFRRPDWQMQQSVAVVGEVGFPGTYVLKTKRDRVSDVVRRAGGLTREAYMAGASLYRERDSSRVDVNLQRALARPGSPADLLLQSGDSLTLPRYVATVKVTGAVNAPTLVAYVPGASMDHYIAAAGGPTRKADRSLAYVRQPNGSVQSIRRRPLLIPDGVPEPKAGAVVVVPPKESSNGIDVKQLAGVTAQVLTAVVALVVAVGR